MICLLGMQCEIMHQSCAEHVRGDYGHTATQTDACRVQNISIEIMGAQPHKQMGEPHCCVKSTRFMFADIANNTATHSRKHCVHCLQLLQQTQRSVK